MQQENYYYVLLCTVRRVVPETCIVNLARGLSETLNSRKLLKKLGRGRVSCFHGHTGAKHAVRVELIDKKSGQAIDSGSTIQYVLRSTIIVSYIVVSLCIYYVAVSLSWPKIANLLGI